MFWTNVTTSAETVIRGVRRLERDGSRLWTAYISYG